MTATSQAGRGFVLINAFNGFYAGGNGSGGEWATAGETSNFNLQIQCPKLVRVWRAALRGSDTNIEIMYNWNIQSPTDGANFA